MDIILVPGLWLNGSSWDAVAARLTEAGHHPRPLTLPGMESAESDRSSVRLADCVTVVVKEIDACEAPSLVVGHSAGCGVVHAAVDARAGRVARAVYIGGFPSPAGRPVAGGFATDGADIPFPELSEFEEEDLADMDDEMLDRFRAGAIPSPASLTIDGQVLVDPARYEVPVTAIATEYRSDDLRGWMAAGAEPVSELTRIRDVEYLDLPTGHWPQFTRPDELAAMLAEIAARSA